MKVVVRIRPDNEKERGTRSVVEAFGERFLIFDPSEVVDDFYFQGIKQKPMHYLKKPNKNREFGFDRVFDSEATNDDVFQHTTRDILDGFLDGYNSSVFAYGATGSGKTFTMLGSPEHPGLIFLTMSELYRRIDEMAENVTVEVAVSYMEVYNENIRDLLSPESGYCPIREDPQRGVVVVGLKLCRPDSAEELLGMLREGNRNRTQHPTDANAESSRSHAVFTVYVRQQNRTGTGVKVAKMSHIDLAGSERANMVSKNGGMRMREGANINKSLLALGNCINALAAKKPNGHIPYRGSKLTRLLKDSLDGNCRTIMIATVSPSSDSYEDTHNTLKYAARATNIEMKLKQNTINVDPHGSHLVKVVDDLRKELAAVKEQLRLKNEGAARPEPGLSGATAPQQEKPTDEEVRMSSRLQLLFAERRMIQQELLHATSQCRELEIKIMFRRRDLESLEAVHVDPGRVAVGASKIDKVIDCWNRRLVATSEKAADANRHFVNNGRKLESAAKEAALLNCRALNELLEMQGLKMELERERQQRLHLKRVALDLQREYERANRFAFSSVKVSRRQYSIMRARGLASCDVDEDYSLLLKQLEGYREIAWADETPVSAAGSAECDHPLPKMDLKAMLDTSLLVVRPAGAYEGGSSGADCGAPPSFVRGTCDAEEGAAAPAVEMLSDSDVSHNFAKLRKIDPTPKKRPRSSTSEPRTNVCLNLYKNADCTSPMSPSCKTPQFAMPNVKKNNQPFFDETFTEAERSPLISTNKRRLTFELPAPSLPILKTGSGSAPTPTPSGAEALDVENVPNAVASSQRATATGQSMKRSRSCLQLASREMPGVRFGPPKQGLRGRPALKGPSFKRSESLKHLATGGAPGADLGAGPPGTSAGTAERVAKPPWKMANFRMRPQKKK